MIFLLFPIPCSRGMAARSLILIRACSIHLQGLTMAVEMSGPWQAPTAAGVASGM